MKSSNESKIIKVAVIDSGISKSYGIASDKILGGIHLYEQGSRIYIDDNFEDTNGHGTSCAYLIQRNCAEARFFIINILNSKGISTSRVLLEALTGLLNSDIKLISLSISTMSKEYLRELSNVCSKLNAEGKIIICSLRKNESYSFPAVFPSVIGVKGRYFQTENTYWFNKSKTIQCIADDTPILTPQAEGAFQVFSGNSKSAALFSGIIASQIINNNIEAFNDICLSAEKYANKTKWKSSALNKMPEMPILHEKENMNIESLDKIAKVVQSTLKLQIPEKLLYSNCLLHPNIGFNINSMPDVLKGLQEGFHIRLNYEEISGRDFISIYTLDNLVSKHL